MQTSLQLVVTGFLALLCVRAYVSRRAIKQVLARHAFREPSLADIGCMVAEVNRVSPTFTFGVKRAANIESRGQRVTVIWGSVGFQTPNWRGPNWGFQTNLYTLADEERGKWMKLNPDAFSPALLASPISVFWVRLSALRANKSAHLTGARCSHQETN